MGIAAARLRPPPLLLALAAAAPVLEVAGLYLAGLGADRALAAQASSPSPWGEFHDLRWLLVIGNSWPAALLEVVGIWMGRSAFNAVLVREARPLPERPAWRWLFTRELLFTLAVLIFLLPWAVIGFGMAIVPISWLFFAALPPVFFIALVMAHGPATAGWWRRPPPLRSVAWIALTFAAMTIAGAALQAVPPAAGLIVAAGAGLFNAWAWCQIVGSVVTRPSPTRIVPLAPGLAVGMVAVTVIGTTVGFQLHKTPPSPALRAAPGARSGPPVLIAGGFDSAVAVNVAPPIPGPFLEVRYSYRGLDTQGAPLPYDAADTHQSVKALVRLAGPIPAAVGLCEKCRPPLVRGDDRGGSEVGRHPLALTTYETAHIIEPSERQHPGSKGGGTMSSEPHSTAQPPSRPSA
jgi:hypothetical protein